MNDAAREQQQGGSPHWEWAALAIVVAGAAALRLIDLGAVRLDPFYDAAVRSMGTSWKNFFFGAWEPGGSASIDKPPVDLWLQVASVKVFGFGSTSLKLPEALGAVAAVGLMYAAVRRVWGFAAGIGAALALAVMPVEVITARSDTMDAVMMALLVGALLLLIKACESGRTSWLLAAAAVLGIAFNVKLLETVVALPGLALIALLGFQRAVPSYERATSLTETLPEAGTPQKRGWLHRRAVPLAGAAVVYVAVALLWLSATLLFPAHERPYAIGSTNGSAWNAAFVFNGLDRIEGKAVEGTTLVYKRGRRSVSASTQEGERAQIPPPSPTRLLKGTGPLPIERLGLELLVALGLGVPALALGFRRAGPLQRAVSLGLVVWLLTGTLLFSAMTRLHPRYVEGFTPAVAALVGIGVAWAAGALSGRRTEVVRGIVFAGVLALVLAIPLVASVKAVKDHVSDAGNVGALPAAELGKLSAYLRVNRRGATYEVAVDSATKASSLIVRDALPVIVLTSYQGQTLTSVAKLRPLIARGEVRYALLNSSCGKRTPRTDAACSEPALWVRAHGHDVSRQAGLTRPGVLWRLPEAIG
jgi:4-amino-4-deoxy-L-arabinose transferase-like glycosyltransferase